MTGMTRARIALVMVAASALVLAATAAARVHAGAPIVIGWAFDSKGAMAPFDGPALAAATLRVKQINARGGVSGRPLQIKTCDTQGNKPAIAKACALKLLGQRREHHVHDVRRRLRRTGRAGDDQPWRPRRRAVHRHRPDGAEALRREGQACLQLRQRRAGRRLGDGRVRLEEGLAQGGDRDRHRHRLLQERDRGVPGALEAARRQGRRTGDVPGSDVRRNERPERDQPAQRRDRRRDRHVDRRRVRRAVDDHDGPAVARERHAGAQLVGR